MRELISTLIVLMPVLSQYASPIPQVSLGEFGLILVTPVAVALRGISIKFPRYAIYLSYVVPVSLAVALLEMYDIREVASRLLREAFHAFIIVSIAPMYFDLDYGSKMYKRIAILACAYIIVQGVIKLTCGIILPWLIPGLVPMINTDIGSYLASAYRKSELFYRPSSFFLEPARFAQYVAPCLVFALFPFERDRKPQIHLAVLVSIAILVSTSGQGIVILALLWAARVIVWLLRPRNMSTVLTVFLMLLLGMSAFTVAYLISPTLRTSIARFSEFDLGGGTTSVNIRVLRGPSIFLQLNPLYKLFGLGSGNLLYHLVARGIQTPFDPTAPSEYMEYVNTFSYILISGGLIGLALMAWAITDCYRRAEPTFKYLILLLITICLTSSIYLNGTWALYMTFILIGSRRNDHPKGCIEFVTAAAADTVSGSGG